MPYLDQLTEVLLSPLGAFLVVAAVLLLHLLPRRPISVWGALGLLIYLASLTPVTVEAGLPSPQFTPPLDILIDLGRPLTIAGVLFVIFLGYRSMGPRRRAPAFLLWYGCSQFVIAAKTIAGGDWPFGSLALAAVVAVLILTSRISSNWLRSEEQVDGGIFAIVTAAAILCLVTLIQFILDPGPLAVHNGKFNGTTANPQHAMLFIALALPSVLFFVKATNGWKRLASVFIGIACLYLLVWTGSRTGLVIALLTCLYMFRTSLGLSRIALLLGGLVAAWIVLDLPVPSPLQDLLLREDTRSATWNAMLRDFVEHPILGARLVEERLGFGENSWLAMAASAGIVGLVPLVLFGGALFWIAQALARSPSVDPADRSRRDAVACTLVAVLVASVTEAFLLGTLTASIFIAILMGLLGNRLLEVDMPALSASPVDWLMQRGPR